MTRSLLAAALVLLLAQPRLARATTLVELLAHPDAAAIVDHFVALGLRIDLDDPAQVAAAIGDVSGLPTRRATSSAFAGFTVPAGEIVFNPDNRGRKLLLVSLRACLPSQPLRDRLQRDDIRVPASRITVLIYEEAELRARPGTALTYPGLGGCLSTLGIAQRKHGT